MRRNVQNSCFGLFCWSGAALLRDAQWSFDHYFCLLQSWASHLWVLRRSQHSCILCCTADQLNQTIDFSTLSDIMKVVFFIIDTYMHNTYGSLLTYHVHVCYMLWTGMDRCGQVWTGTYIIPPQHLHDIFHFSNLSSCNDVLGGLRCCPVEVHICRKDLPTGHSHKNASPPQMIPRCFRIWVTIECHIS